MFGFLDGGGGDPAGRSPAAGGFVGDSFRLGSRYCAHEATTRAAWPSVKAVMHGSTLRRTCCAQVSGDRVARAQAEAVLQTVNLDMRTQGSPGPQP